MKYIKEAAIVVSAAVLGTLFATYLPVQMVAVLISAMLMAIFTWIFG